MEGWPQAKRAVIEAEREVQQFEVPWAEAWKRAKARAWAEVKVLRAGWVSGGQAEAEALGEALGEARAQPRGESMPDGLTDPPTIADILL